LAVTYIYLQKRSMFVGLVLGFVKQKLPHFFCYWNETCKICSKTHFVLSESYSAVLNCHMYTAPMARRAILSWCPLTWHVYIVYTILSLNISSIYISGRVFAPCAGGRGFDPQPHHTKDIIKMIPDASLLSSRQVRLSMAEMDSICNERSKVKYISCYNLLHNYW